MTSLAQIRAGIMQNVATISGLRTSDLLPESPNPPVAILNLSDIDYDNAFNKGLTIYNFDLTVLVGRADARGSQAKLDEYVASDGVGSIKMAVESNRTLNGLIYDLKVTQLRSIGSLTVNDTTYLAADFNVVCYAS